LITRNFSGYTFGGGLNEYLRQDLCYNFRITENLFEYYQPVEKEMHQQGQGLYKLKLVLLLLSLFTKILKPITSNRQQKSSGIAHLWCSSQQK